MFIDEAKIEVSAGSGGNGCSSLYRDKYLRHGRPDGGDGGRGGNVVFTADKRLFTLLDFRYKRHFSAENGGHGGSKGKKGRNGEDCIIRIPCGTILKDTQTNLIIRDLKEDKESVIVVKGGQGGLGNIHKREATQGSAGEEREINLELKLIADVGVVGFPNSGKSTLLNRLTNSHPKIANYPFTTKDPVLGLLSFNEEENIIIAEIPGIIEGAHKGKGLGDRFLRHTERTKLLIHLIDMASVDGRRPIEDYKVLTNELELYSQGLDRKPRLLVANKMDIKDSRDNLKEFKRQIKKKIIPISAQEKEGLGELKDAIRKSLQKNCN
jgi:GTP-binding protein